MLQQKQPAVQKRPYTTLFRRHTYCFTLMTNSDHFQSSCGTLSTAESVCAMTVPDFQSQITFISSVTRPSTTFTVWRFQETNQSHWLCINEQCDQTNVWTFRCFNRTNTTIVCLMYVTYLKALHRSRVKPPGPAALIHDVCM